MTPAMLCYNSKEKRINVKNLLTLKPRPLS